VPLTTAAGLALCAYASWDLATRGEVPREWFALLGLTAAAGVVTLRVPAMPISFSISDTFTILAALLVGPSAGALTAALDGLVLSFRMTRRLRTLTRVGFNVGSLAIANWTAGTVYLALAGTGPVEGPLAAFRLLVSMGAFGALHFALNSGLVAAAVAFERGGSFTAIWRQHFSTLWMSSFGGTFAAMLMIVLARQSALEVLILVAPLPVVLYVALRHALGRAEDQIEHLGKMNRVYVATIEALAQAVDAKDQVTHDHVRRVQEKSLRLAESLGVTDSGELQALQAAGLLHDVGKIGIPEHILNKPGRLTPSEFEIMKRHPAIGADILSVIGFPYPLIPIVRHHHENWDGTGYPDGLAGEAIPIGARILQVVDCFDALTSDRPYRRAMRDEDALAIVAERSGTMYDPRVVDALLALQAVEPVRAAAPQDAGEPRAVEPPAAEPPRAEAPAGIPARAPAAPRDLLAVAAGMGAAVGARRTPALIADAVWNGLREHVPATAFVLFVNEGHTLVPAYRFGLRGAPMRIPVGERLSGWVAATRSPILNSDARLDFDGPLREQTPLRAAMAVPVTQDNESVGVLAFYADVEGAFDDAHQRLAAAAAHVVANALPKDANDVAVAV
jgi:putative nucleotidyltransferase with HDIG domain